MKKLIGFICVLVVLITAGISAKAANYVYSASVKGEVSLHISPDDASYKITDIPACSKIKLIRTERTWGLVEFKNKCGWINLSFTRDTYDNAAEASGNDDIKNVKVKAKEKKVSLYNVPSVEKAFGSEEKYAVPDDTVLKITRVTPLGWGLVSMNGKYAWIQIENTKDYKDVSDAPDNEYGIYYVYVLSDKGAGLELYSEAGKGNLLAVIPDCIKLTVREKKNNYAYVSYDGINGWIDIRYTTQSLSNAQSNAGIEVNVEYEIVAGDNEDAVQIMSVPSDNPADGGLVVGSIEKGTAVFVLRSTLSGWNLINYNGVLGWIAPSAAVPAEMTEVDLIEPLSEKKKGYISTFLKKGLELYSEIGAEDTIASIPECTEVTVIASSDGYEYIYCDYAAGWAEEGSLAGSYEDAVSQNPDKKKQAYITKSETQLFSLPVTSELCKSEEIMVIGANTYFEVTKTVTTGKNKWGLMVVSGKQGWINLGQAKKTIAAVWIILIIIIAVLLAATAVFFSIRLIKKIRKR